MEMNFKKKCMVFLVVFVGMLFFVGFSVAVTPNPGHDANETGPGTFGGDINSVYGFPGNLNIGKLLFFNAQSYQNGIFWGASSRDVTKPHIEYVAPAMDVTWDGLWISTGNESTAPVHFENDIKISNGKNVTLGGVSRGTWPSEVPPGFCVFSDSQSNCPTGWTKRALVSTDNFYGRTLRGSSSPGLTGGAETHKHATPDDCNPHLGGDDSCDLNPADYTNNASSWPPYVNVTICCKDTVVSTPVPMPPAQLIAKECAAGEYMSGISSNGTVICKTQTGGCNWIGWKCVCGRDKAGTQGAVVVGLYCNSTTRQINDLKVTVVISTNTATCNEPTWCDVWQ